MAKIGLVAVTYKDNFGSALQTYATQYVLQKMGCETGIFQIDGVSNLINRRKAFFYMGRLFASDERKYIFDQVVSKVKRTKKSELYSQNMRLRHECYEEFNKDYLCFLEEQTDWDALRQQSLACDAVVVGSDQLWRPSNIAGRYFTLEFVPDGVKKIAYATSFGVPVLPRAQISHAQKFLGRMDAISVRENTGKEIVKQLIGRNVPVVCDPTILLDAEEWMKIQRPEPVIQGDYILCYLLGDNQKHREFVKQLRRITGMPVVGLLHGSNYIASDETLADIAPFDVGPCEFINLIRNAQYVCTDSFHGTVFSILNRRSFFTFGRYRETSDFSTNDRVNTLLAWCGLSDRLMLGDESTEAMLAEEIHYDAVHDLIDEKRTESLRYLADALGPAFIGV